MAVVYYNTSRFIPDFAQEELQLLYVCQANEEQTRLPTLFHSHDYLEIQYISKGSGRISVGERVYEVKAGDLILYTKGVMHNEVANPEEGMCFYNCGIEGMKRKSLPSGTVVPHRFIPVIHLGDLAPQVESLFSVMWHQLDKGERGSATSCHYLLYALLTILIRQTNLEPMEAPDEKEQAFMEVKQYIDEHYTETFRMEDLANNVHMSMSTLNHQFKKRMGMSPVQYIIRCRIGKAQGILISSDRSITDVSADVGYDNLSYFNNQFKKLIGMSPQSYRKYRVGDNQYKQLNKIMANFGKTGIYV